jgi:excisionase family DNA binding protein
MSRAPLKFAGLRTQEDAVKDDPLLLVGLRTGEDAVKAEPLLLAPEVAAERLQCGRTMIYELMATGQIESVKVGRLRRIPTAALAAYVARLREQARAVA